MGTPIREALREFGETLTANFATADLNPAQAEDQLKGPAQILFKRVGDHVGRQVVARTEARTELGVRPDLGVTVSSLLAGHVELKAPGKGARANAFTDPHDREQFKRLSDHPNLLYTDGNEWALYRLGAIVGKVVRAEGDVRTDGTSAYSEASSLQLEVVLHDFLEWEPIVPPSPKALAEMLAPLTRLLRENVRTALADEGTALSELAGEWRSYFFPEADDAQFADAYAQTVTYALLLARVEGEQDLHARAAERLDERHGLLAQVLRVLEEPAARKEVEVPIDLLERSIAAVDPEQLAKRAKGDLWLYFYEDFLAAYDAKLRKQRGVYFTPPPVVQAQTALVDELLRERFDKPLGFADDEVTVLDPAVGTGTYLLAAAQSGLERVREQYGDGAMPNRASEVAANFHGFELLIGAYAVAHLRFAQQILQAKGQLPKDGVHIYLTDTLTSPNLAPKGKAHAPLFHKKLAEENERARHVKADTRVLVCIGNPPYFRQVIEPGEEGVERQGGWVRKGDEGKDGILNDFLRDAPPVHAKNLYNLYVYFWRWALWKVFENSPGRGVVSFITASSYLRGPGFAGMRQFMRKTLDELWILDLGGEGRGARQSENVFDIQTPVAIAVGVRYDEPQASKPAVVRYARVDGAREAKFATLRAINSFARIDWQECFSGWTEPFLPQGAGDFFSWPALTDLFPWQQPGVKAGRTWVIAPDRQTLAARWKSLIAAPSQERTELFKNSPTGRQAQHRPQTLPPGEGLLEPIETTSDVARPGIPYGYRSFDRQYLIADARVLDRPGPALWLSASARQLYMTSLLTGLLGSGPAATVTNLLPDLHHFRGSFGGKDVIPLWRDADCTRPNVTAGLLDVLSTEYEREVSPEDLFAYCYAILAAPGYIARYTEELEVPGPHVPLTRDATIFESAVELGKGLLWLHTRGERFIPDGRRVGQLPQGDARAAKPVGGTPDSYPTRYEHDEDTQELRVGDGVFAPVTHDVWSYSVSGLHVLGSWLDYRMKEGAGRRSSPLDKIRPETWPAAFTEELLRLIWILERTVALGPDLNTALAAVVAGPTFRADELPTPSDEERAAPSD